jgi:NADH dehydrogenase FAD-containing subunit
VDDHLHDPGGNEVVQGAGPASSLDCLWQACVGPQRLRQVADRSLEPVEQLGRRCVAGGGSGGIEDVGDIAAVAADEIRQWECLVPGRSADDG